MAEVVTRVEIVRHLKGIIAEAEVGLILISPYLKTDDETKSLIEQASNFVRIHLLHGKKQLQAEERESLESRRVEISFRKNLHAKCYLNEKRALVTSMNLHEYSQRNNDELGILVTKQDDAQLYEEIRHQALKWLEEAAPYKILEGHLIPAYCIHCATLVIGLAYQGEVVSQPFCDECYETWKRYQNYYDKEKYCHVCGRSVPTSCAEPLCIDCNVAIREVAEELAGFWGLPQPPAP